MRAWTIAIATIATLSACTRCGEPGAAGAGARPADTVAAAEVASVRRLQGNSDVTFLVVSDTHFGFGGMPAAHEVLIPKLKGIAGRPFPTAVGGSVAPPRGLLVTGDLTEWGDADQWEPFARTYGRDGGADGQLRIPFFEVVGNHDKVHGPFVEQQVMARHGGNRFYSWDWGDVHLVALGDAPDEQGLDFLARDLEHVARDVPVVLYFHLALAGPWSTDNWFAEGTLKDRLARIAEQWNVIAIFHGHHHATGHYVWRGVDVFKPGAVKDGAHTFAVVHVTDDRMSVVSYDWDRDAWAGVFDKRLPIKKR
ncbi:metallophosphoesterase [soil metagenome]